MSRVLLESKRLGNLAWELFFFWEGGGVVNFCPGISWGFVGNPRDFLGF